MAVPVRYVIISVGIAIAIAAATLIVRNGVRDQHEALPEDHDGIAGPAVLKAGADTLKATLVTPHLGCAISGDQNLLWCATFQLAWDVLCDLLGGPIASEAASDVVSLLNERRITAADVDEDSYVALAGHPTGGVDDILDRISAALKQKFGGAAQPAMLPDRASLGPGDWVAYAYLFKSLPFEWAFTRNRTWGMSFAGRDVQTFGIHQLSEHEEDEVSASRQVLVYDYRDANDFIIELKTRSKSDRLILAKTAPAPTLDQTIRAVQARLDVLPAKSMVKMSDLRICVLDFDITKHYAGLVENGWAGQQIRFKLDETGAVLKSESMAFTARTQDLVFDKPFLVWFLRAGAKNPYFALWVANAELLPPVEETLRPPGTAAADRG